MSVISHSRSSVRFGSENTAPTVKINLIDIDERQLTPPRATLLGTLQGMPASEIVGGIAFAILMAFLLFAMAVFS